MQRFHRLTPHLFVIIIVPLILLWRWVFKGEVLFWGTPLFQFWPWHYLVGKSLLAGEWPLWNPLLGNGTPLLANLQTAVFYPPNLLYLLIPVEHGLTFSVVLHLILAGLFMYLYTRHIGLLPFAATLSALTYMLSGYLIGRAQFITMVNAAAWLPLMLFSCERLVIRRFGLDIIWLGLVLALQLLAGHAQIWYYSLWLIAFYTIFRTFQEMNTRTQTDRLLVTTKQGWLALTQASWRLGLAIILALLLAAGQLLPTAELVAHSVRSTGVERTFALTYSFWPWRLVTLLAPDFFGNPANNSYWGYANYWEDHAYVGVLPLLLALTAVWRYFRLKRTREDETGVGPESGTRFTAPTPISPSSHEASASGDPVSPGHFRNLACWQVIPFYAVVVPVSLVLAMGWNTPIYLWVFDKVPGFGYFQAPARLLIWYTVAMALLAGIGAQFFAITPRSLLGWRRLLVACIGLTVAGLAGRFFLSGRSITFLGTTTTLGIWLILSVLLLLTQPGKSDVSIYPRHTSLWQWSALGLVALDLLLAAFPLIRTLPPTTFRQGITSADFLKSQSESYRYFVDNDFERAIKFNQYFRFDTFGPTEVSHWLDFRETLVPNVGVYIGLPSANNDDPLVVRQLQQLSNLVKNADTAQRARILSLMNVGYYIDDPGRSVWPVIYKDTDVAIQRVPQPLPRAYFVPKAHLAKNSREVVTQLTSPDFDPRLEVVIMKSKTSAANQALEALSEPIREANVEDSSANVWPVSVNDLRSSQVLLSVDAPTSGFVVLTDIFYPGWQANVDGRPGQIWPANLAFRAVAIEAGHHDIMFSYRSLSFTIGLWISTVTVVIVVISSTFLKYNGSRAAGKR